MKKRDDEKETSEEMDYSQPPKNVFGLTGLCPKCGGLGFTRGPGGIYDYRDCPNRLCDKGTLTTEEAMSLVEKELPQIIKTGQFQKEDELAERSGVSWSKIADMRLAMMDGRR